MEKCPVENCYAPDTSCPHGHTSLSKCPDWSSAISAVEGGVAIGDDVLMPWSGSVLGLLDTNFVAGRAKPIVVGVVGPHSAGKTTLLACWYLLIGNGLAKGLAGRFAGSYSLEGWEAVAAALRWTPGGKPGFPPHTPSRAGRAPGLLHLSFRPDGDPVKDFLFTDAPGEWFYRWAVNAEADDAEGARWVSDKSDVLLIIADREALSGSDRGSARNDFQLLASRISSERRARPIALVWTKTDTQIDADMEAKIRRSVFDTMPDAKEFSVTILSDSNESGALGHLQLLDWILDSRRPAVSLANSVSSSLDPLFLYGRR
jgi:Double-GTPase 2